MDSSRGTVDGVALAGVGGLTVGDDGSQTSDGRTTSDDGSGHDVTNTGGRDTSGPARADRFDRNVRAFGIKGQRRLGDVTAGIVGVGGLGSLVAEQLARLGVTEFVLVDPDIVEESNLSRLVGAYDHHVGRPKVTAIREHLWQSGTDDVDVETHRE
jgi:hypothetical protein